MLLYYVRHGEPTYDPDELTPNGKRQAEAVARRLARFGLDKIFSSTAIRAQQTAKPAAELTRQYNALKAEIERLYEEYERLENAMADPV